MTRHPNDADNPDLDGPFDDCDEIYLPFDGRRSAADNGGGDDLDLDRDLDLDEEGGVGGGMSAVRMRPPPRELSRRDRQEWRRLEVQRINRAAQAVVSRRHDSSSASWSGGFMNNPPRGLGRQGRKAWLIAEQDATKQWWTSRRASNRDIDARAAGAAVIALVIGIGVVIALVTHHSVSAGGGAAASSSVTFSAIVPSTPLTATGVQPTGVVVVPGATGSVAVATRNPAIGATPTVAPPLSGQWQPTPAGGIPATTPRTAAPVNPAAVKIAPAPAGPITRADQASAQAVVAAWLARICPSSWRDRFGADLQRGKQLQTVAAWKIDDPARDTVGAALWRSEVLAHQQTRQCGNLTVTVSPDQPLTAGGGFVLYSVDRVVTSAAGHLPTAVEHLSGARRVVHVGGSWLVDIAVVGG